MKRFRFGTLVAASALLSASTMSAATITWTTNANGDWLTGSNWSGGVMPGTGDVANFTGTTSALLFGIDFGGATNNGAANQAVGEILASGTALRTIGAGTATDGVLTVTGINGVLIASVSGFGLVLAPNANGGTGNMTVNLASAGNIDIGNNGAITISAAITGVNGLTKTGIGAGALLLSGSNTYTGATTLAGGSTTLDYTTMNNAKVDAASALNMTGSSLLTLTGNATAATAQSVSGLNIVSGSNRIVVTPGSGQTATLTLGAITRSGLGTINFSATGTILTDTLNTGNFIGTWATLGNDWAVNSTNAAGGAIVAYTGYTNDTWGAGLDTTVTASSAPTSGSTTNTLRFNAAGAFTLTLAGSNVITSGGLLVGTTVGNNASTITGGTLTSGSGDLLITQLNTSNTLSIVSAITDNGVTPTTITKTGAGTLALKSTANTFSGNVLVEGGTLQFDTGGASANLTSGSNVTVTVTQGSVLSLIQTESSGFTSAKTWTLGSTVALNDGTLNLGGNFGAQFQRLLSTTAIRLSGNSTIAQPAGGGSEYSQYVAIEGTVTGNGTLNLNRGGSTGNAPLRFLNFNGDMSGYSGNVVIGASAAPGGYIIFGNASGWGSGSLTLSGAGSNVLLGDETSVAVDSRWSGGSTTPGFTSGTLATTAAVTVGAGANLLINNASTNAILFEARNGITVNGGTLGFGAKGLVTAAGTTTGNSAFVGYQNTSWTFGGAALSTVSANVRLSYSGFTLDVADAVAGAGVDTLVSGVISGANGFTKTSAGTLQLTAANTYSGTTTINAGTMLVGAGGTTGSLGTGDVVLAGGTLAYNRSDNISLTTAVSGTGTVSQQGTGLLTLNGSNLTGTGSINATSGRVEIGAAASGGSGYTLTRSAGGTFNVVSGSGFAVANTNDVTGIIGGWATYNGTDWAVANGASAISAFTGYANDVWAAGNDTTVTTGSVVATGSTTNSLRFNAPTNGIVTLSGTNIITTGGILVTSAVGSAASVITGGTLEGSAGGDLIVYQNNTAGTLTIGSAIANNGAATGLTKTGAGTLVVTGANTFTGTVNVTGGALQVGDGVSSTATLGASNAVNLSTGTSLSFNVASASIDMAGVISGAAAVAYNGANGVLAPAGYGYNVNNASTYTGGTTITGSRTNLSVAGGFGTGAVTVNATGQFYTGTALTVTNNITINGNGWLETPSSTSLYVQNGAIRAGAATTFSGTITVASASRIGAGAASVISGVLAGSANLEINGAANVNSTLSLSGTANTYSGAVTVSSGTLNLSGTLTTASSITVAPGATLIFDHTGTNANKLGAATTLNLGGSLTLTPNATAATNSTQTLAGGINLVGGATITVNKNAGTGNATLNLGTVSRAGGTANFVYGTTGTGVATATTNNLNSGGILGGWATVGGANWAFNATNAAAGAISAYSAYTNDTWASGNNTTVTASGTIADASLTNSLRFGAAAVSALTLSGTGTIATGGILVASTVAANATSITGGTLMGGAGGELFIQQFSTGTMTVSSVIADNGSATGLTKSGTGALTLSGTSANTFTGLTTINAGTVTMSKTAGINALGGNVSLTGGALVWTNSEQIANTATLSISGLGAVTFGAITETVAATIVSNNTSKFNPGSGSTFNTGSLAFIGTNGGAVINNYSLAGNSTSGTSAINVGAGGLSMTDSFFQIGQNAAVQNAVINLAGNFTGSGNVELTASGVTSTGVRQLNLGVTAHDFTITGTTLITAEIAGAGASITKKGSGTLIIQSVTGGKAHSYSGGMTVAAGTLMTGGVSALGTGSVTVNAGGTLQVGDGTTNGVTLGSGATLTVAGTLKLTSVASAVTLTGGSYNLSGGTLDLSNLFNNVTGTQQYTLITGGSGNTDGLSAITGYNTSAMSAVFSQGVLTLTATAVPEPAAYGLLGAASLATVAFVRRRRKCA